MEVHWWQLPGPTRFIQAIVQDLRSGKNIVLAFPMHAPDGFREALAERVREYELWRWRTICATEFPSDSVASLTRSLHQRFIATPQANDLCTPLSLAQRLVSTIIWIETTADKALPAWAKFLVQYQHACQNCDPCDRSMFCLSLTGNPDPTFVSDVALSVRRWEGRVDRLDMTLYLDRMLFSRFPHPLHHKVSLAVATELAGSDEHLARQLAKQDLAVILDPFPLLSEYAATRGWSSDAVLNDAWQDGTNDVVDGARMLHSAFAAAKGDRSEVTRRVWRGQVASLYPFIEEQRIKIIPQVRGYIRLPVETPYGRVKDIEDLELGQLLYFLRGKRIHQRLWRLLTLLTEMRHSLAHLETVPLRSLLAEEILHVDG